MAITKNDHDGLITINGTTSTAQSVFTDRRDIRWIYWYRPTTVGHMAHFLTGTDKDFVRFYCDNADCSQNLPCGGHPVQGLKIDDLDSGTIKISYFK